MTDKLTVATLAPLLCLLAGSGCTEQQPPKGAAGAAGALGNTVERTAPAPTAPAATRPAAQPAPTVQPAPTAPNEPQQLEQPIELPGAQFGVRYRAARKLVRLA